MIFTIENETDNITAHASVRDAETVPNSERFKNEVALAKLAASWPTFRLIEIWNSLPGATPVKKFTDRKKAVGRIWKAIQSLGESTANSEATNEVTTPFDEVTAEPRGKATNEGETLQVQTPVKKQKARVSAQASDVAPANGLATKKAARKENAPAGETAGKAPRDGSKTSQVIAMLKREGGTTLEELMSAISWQKHTTRAMLSAGGSLTKKHGLVVTSEKVGDKRTYSIKA